MISLRSTSLLIGVLLASGCGNQPERVLVPRTSEPASTQRVLDSELGPRICFFNAFFDYCYPSGGYFVGTAAEVPLDVPAGRAVTMNWRADPNKARVRASRWSLDIADVTDQTPRIDEETDLEHWSIWSAGPGSARLGPWGVGERHKLFVEVEDDLGFRSLGIVRFTAVEAPPACGRPRVEPAVLWPPDQGLVPVSIGIADPQGGRMAITVTRVTQDEPVTGGSEPVGLAMAGDLGRLDPISAGLGLEDRPRRIPAGEDCPDAVIGRMGRVALRAERLGDGNGRVYRIWFTATDRNGGSCEGSVQVCVPHDRRGPACRDDGQIYDSTGPCPSGP